MVIDIHLKSFKCLKLDLNCLELIWVNYLAYNQINTGIDSLFYNQSKHFQRPSQSHFIKMLELEIIFMWSLCVLVLKSVSRTSGENLVKLI